MPNRPPAQWFKDKVQQVKKSLKDAHPDWSEETLSDRAQETVGDLWYNKLTQNEKEKILRENEGEVKARKEFDDHDALCSKIEDEMKNKEQETEDALKMVRSEVKEPPVIQEDKPIAESRETPIHDGMDRLQQAGKNGKPDFVSVPMFKTQYVAAPKFEGKDAPIIIKAIVLEQGHNLNRWRVVEEEFPKVAEQYKAGRHLRVNHGKDVQDVIGKSFDGKVIKGVDIEGYLGKKLDGVNKEGTYVIAEFEANPQDQQIRTNILNGYVETGSIGLDASAFCEKCDKALIMKSDSFDRSCKHYDSPIKLRNVEVKEYSYVAEPAFEHTKAFPSFGAAVNNVFENSSLTYKPTNTDTEMTDPTKVEQKIEATATKVAEANAFETMAKAYAESEYKRGKAEGELAAMKARAEEKPVEEDKKVTASASKTDQVGIVDTKTTEKPSNESTLINKVWDPIRTWKANKDSMGYLFLKEAMNSPSAPSEMKGKFKSDLA